MSEVNFINLEDIGNYKVRFKFFVDDRDGYQSVFHLYDKSSTEIHYQIDFMISKTEYNKDSDIQGKLVRDSIDEKYDDLENCFKEIGTKYLKDKIVSNGLKNEIIGIASYI